MSISLSFAKPCHLSLTCLNSIITAIMSDHTLASSAESMLLAVQALQTSSPINVASTASVVPAPTENVRVAEALVSIREGPNTTQRSHTLDTIPETQDLDIDLEVVLPNISIGVGHFPYEEIVDPANRGGIAQKIIIIVHFLIKAPNLVQN